MWQSRYRVDAADNAAGQAAANGGTTPSKDPSPMIGQLFRCSANETPATPPASGFGGADGLCA